MSVTEAIERELARLPDDLAQSALAALALQLGGEMDDVGNSSTSKSMNARVLYDVLLKLRELAPREEVKDGIDQLAAKRKQRRSRSAASARTSRT